MRRSVGTGVFVRFISLLVCAVSSLSAQAQQPAAPAPTTVPVSHKSLTVDRIYGGPRLSGPLSRGIAWTPASKQLNFFETKRAGEKAKNPVWGMDVAPGAGGVLLSTHQRGALFPP